MKFDRSAWLGAFDAGAPAATLRRAAWIAGLALVAALATLAGGGQPLLVLLPALLLLAWALQDPWIALLPMVLTQVIWVIGGYAIGGSSMLAPSKLTLALAWLGYLLWAWRARVAPTYAPHMLGIAGFMAVVIAGPIVTPAFVDSLIGIGKYGLMVLPYLVVANLAVERRGIRIALLSVTVTACLSAGLAIFERLLPGIDLVFEGVSLGAHLDDESLRSVAIKRVTGGIGDANWFSYTMVTTLPLCVYWFRVSASGWVRSASVAAGLLLLAGVVLSYTRTPMIGLAGALAFLVWQRRIAVFPVVVAAVVALVSAPAWLPAGFLDRFISKEYIAEGSTPVRKEIFDMAIELIEARPLTGHGYQTFGPQFIERSTSELGWELERRDRSGEEPAYLLRAHNLYLDIWAQHGIFGLIALAGAFVLLLREMWTVSRVARPPEADLALCLFASLLAFFLCGLGGHSQELKVFWILAGIAAGLRRWVLSGYAAPEGSARA